MIQIDNLSKTYYTSRKHPGILGSLKGLVRPEKFPVQALKDVSFQIDDGEFVGLIGPNGAGKTTLAKIMTGLLYPDEGSKVSVLGSTPFDKRPQFLTQISFVSGQKNQLLWDLSAMDSFLLQKEIYKIEKNRFTSIVDELSEMLKITEQLNVPVRKLSFGQRMKLEIMASLLHSPKVLFLDEPTIGLDLLAQKNVRAFLKSYNQRYGATIVITSHNLDDIKKLCERVIIINKGNILYDGSLSRLNDESVVSSYKVVEIAFEDDEKVMNIEKYSGMLVTKENDKLKLKVPSEKIRILIPELLKDFTVRDISIQETDIEEVIGKIMFQEEADWGGDNDVLQNI